MDTPKIQIIIPVYNAEKYLRRCLDSLKNQTYQGWNAILVDDASADGSVGIIDEYIAADSRFTCIRKSENSGAAVARNTALERLSAEYTAFLDSDDYWESDMLEVMIKAAEENSCDVVQCRFVYDFPSGRRVLPAGAFRKDTVLEGDKLKGVFVRMMTGINMNHVCMKLIRTELLGGMRFDAALKTAEDLKFCVGLFKAVKRYCFVNKPLYHYCRNDESLTGKGLPFSERLAANRDVSREIVKALPVWNMDNIFYRALSYMRPYTIMISKVWRIMRERKNR